MFRYVVLFLIGFCVSWLGFSSAVWAEKGRVALVIGNSAYKHTSPLDNPKNDAVVMSKVLTELLKTLSRSRFGLPLLEPESNTI